MISRKKRRNVSENNNPDAYAQSTALPVKGNDLGAMKSSNVLDTTVPRSSCNEGPESRKRAQTPGPFPVKGLTHSTEQSNLRVKAGLGMPVSSGQASSTSYVEPPATVAPSSRDVTENSDVDNGANASSIITDTQCASKAPTCNHTELPYVLPPTPKVNAQFATEDLPIIIQAILDLVPILMFPVLAGFIGMLYHDDINGPMVAQIGFASTGAIIGLYICVALHSWYTGTSIPINFIPKSRYCCFITLVCTVITLVCEKEDKRVLIYLLVASALTIFIPDVWAFYQIDYKKLRYPEPHHEVVQRSTILLAEFMISEFSSSGKPFTKVEKRFMKRYLRYNCSQLYQLFGHSIIREAIASIQKCYRQCEKAGYHNAEYNFCGQVLTMAEYCDKLKYLCSLLVEEPDM